MKFCILQADRGSPYTRERYGTYGDLFKKLLEESDHRWDVYHVPDMKFPEKLEQYDGFVITGSAADAHGAQPWILQLKQVIQKVHLRKAKILGVCFGHQVVAGALGGSSFRNGSGWEIGSYTLNLAPIFYEKWYASHIGSRLQILQIHQDHVTALPAGAEILASTAATPVQIFAIDDNVLCLQGHPEFNADILADLVKTRLKSGRILPDVGQRALNSLEIEQDQASLRQMLKRFLFTQPE